MHGRQPLADTSGTSRNWFAQGGQAYARFRPAYPPELARYLAALSPDTALAADVGCGNGQLTTQLAAHFEQVIGLDPSAGQLAHAIPHERVRYACASAEQMPLRDGCASLVTAAQAAHWFDLPRFHAEVRRVARDGAAVALVSYGVLWLDGLAGERFMRFYRDEIGPYWPPERRLVDSGYEDLPFPFEEQPTPALHIRQDWTLDELLGYIATWSAVRHAREAGQEGLLHRFADDLKSLWGGDASLRRELRWPIRMRVGIV